MDFIGKFWTAPNNQLNNPSVAHCLDVSYTALHGFYFHKVLPRDVVVTSVD